MLPALLTVFKKWNYPPYKHTCDGNIWTSRDDILEYEKALEAEKVLEQIIETPVDTSGRRRATKTPGYGRDEFATLAPRRAFTNPLTTPGSVTDTCLSMLLKKEEETDPTYLVTLDEPEADEETVTAISKDQKMVIYLKDCIFPRWRELLSIREAQAGQSRSAALEHFETGMIS
jgi:fanconi-associated nuclease 1